jgi:hypothetical protein
LIAGIAIASPMLAWSASDPGQQVAQAGPGAQGGGPEGGGAAGEAGGDSRGESSERGPMGHRRGGWLANMTHRMSPQQRCEERLARRAGMIAYTIAKLNLTQDQQTAWDKVRGPLKAAGDKERQLCADLKPREQRAAETVLDRLNHREQSLSVKLAAIQQVKPAMDQFYQALSPDQKAIIDHPFHRR